MFIVFCNNRARIVCIAIFLNFGEYSKFYAGNFIIRANLHNIQKENNFLCWVVLLSNYRSMLFLEKKNYYNVGNLNRCK